MNIVEKEAKKFGRDFYKGLKINNLENLKSKLTSKLHNFNRDKDKLDFLKILLQESVNEKENHSKTCRQNGCVFEDDRDTGIFVIDQEIESINRNYHYEPLPNDAFTPKEEAELHSKLNEIINKLVDLGYGQEIIFEEIESLKNHFDLGKKNWFQLLKGKLLDLTVDEVLDNTVVPLIYNTLAQGFDTVVKMIN